MPPRALAAWAGMALLLGAPLSAQSWRTLDVARQLADSSPASVNVVYGTGSFGVRATPNPVLYHMELKYDAERAQPRHVFDPAKRTLQLGVQKSEMRFGDHGENESGHLQLEFSRSTPLDLSLDLGAVEADMDLTGLPLRRLRFESDASASKLRFDALNPTRMSVLEVSLGAASFRGQRLANANAANIRVDAGVGNVDLDMSGQWTRDIDLHVDVTLGVVTIHVPADVGVRVSLQKAIASFEHDGLIQRDGAWVTPNWDSAPRKLRVSAETTFGKLKIDNTGQ